jgi:hypothetical protein
MKLTAEILSYSLTERDENGPVFEFSLHDGEDTATVSFTSTIDLAHATFLFEHLGVRDASYTDAYGQMVQAICCADGPAQWSALVGKEFTSED